MSVPSPVVDRSPVEHPRLRPGLLVVSRDARTAQVGAGSDALLIRGADQDLVRLLDGLDGSRSRDQLGRLHPRASEAIDLLADHGLLLGPRPSRRPPVLLVGAGVLGRACAAALVEARVPLLLCDPDPAPAGLYPDPARPSAAAALRAWLDARRHPSRAPVLGVLGHWSELGAQPPAVALVALDRGEADRGLTDTLMRRDLPHLLVRPLDGGAQIGPFVTPGHDSCTRCTDLYRRAHDPAWPQVLAGLTRRRVDVDPAVARWAAALAVPQVLAALSGRRPDLQAHTVELDPIGWSTRWRRWPAHPECGCDLASLVR